MLIALRGGGGGEEELIFIEHYVSGTIPSVLHVFILIVTTTS